MTLCRRPLATAALACAALAAGCGAARPPVPRVPTTQWVAAATAGGLRPPVFDEGLDALVVPPVGWRPEPRKSNAKHVHQTWISPTGDTAYGVIRFPLPFPVGRQLALWGFMREMRKAEGDATLLSKQDDDALPGLRFDAEGGLYRIRCNLIVEGARGWAVYAGTLRQRPVNPAELKLAADAREQTRVGTN